MGYKCKKIVPIIMSVILCVGLAGCSGAQSSAESTASSTAAAEQETLAESAAEEPVLKNSYLVTNMYGDGQKPWYVVLEYNAEVDPASVAVDDYEIEDYTVEAVFTNTEAALPAESTAGSYVLVEISTDYTTTNYGGSGSGDAATLTGGPMSGGNGPDAGSMGSAGPGENGGRPDAQGKPGDEMPDGGVRGGGAGMLFALSPSNQLEVTFKQTGSITFTNGSVLDAWNESITTSYSDNVNLLVENFSQYSFTLADGTNLMYSLYLPDNYSEGTEYPLVLFMPDATGEGSDEYLALTESLGGVIWTTEEWQSEHETIVLVPQYEDSNSQNPAYTMELVNEIVSQYSIDRTREYLVGQSSGTIRSIKLLIDYPDEFAGALLVAGQTDSAYTSSMAELASQNIWMICSEGDARAYPGMAEITEAVEGAGTPVTIAQWSATLADEEQEQLAAEQAAAGTTINWTIFDAETVMREDVSISDATEHMNTWRVAYDIDTAREWLFEQIKAE